MVQAQLNVCVGPKELDHTAAMVGSDTVAMTDLLAGNNPIQENP